MLLATFTDSSDGDTTTHFTHGSLTKSSHIPFKNTRENPFSSIPKTNYLSQFKLPDGTRNVEVRTLIKEILGKNKKRANTATLEKNNNKMLALV